MSTKFKNLRNDLEDLEQEGQFDVNESSSVRGGKSNSKLANYILLFAFLATLTFYAGSKINFDSLTWNPIENIVQELNQPNESLLTGMGEWMEEMGYGTLTREELIALRQEGVTATYTSQIRDAGYTDVTLDQLVELSDAGVSATFTRMMKELGYELSIPDLIDLERAGVTAYFTSNMLDLGYTMEDLSKENLIRLGNIGVTHSLAERLIEEQEVRPTIDELIRYRISNQ
ncbi:MAG: hypothetical protein CL670_06055 [Balneola sp.]|jgi:hypothetical protein|nr:hypothetical protein [Balneola sp.]MBE78699.1 hypothetical protein [Balneola sp.]HBX67122.1 hypothetical protein [Balneolaceae bacterium]|tara:strand:- start:830 stop:1519 length:690 start_codon:yes stop_codon:yes gene_type:complete